MASRDVSSREFPPDEGWQPVASVPMIRRVALVLALLLVVAGCARSGNPESFDDQPEDVPAWADDFPAVAAAANAGPDGDQIPLVELNFLEGCITADTLRLESLSGNDLAEACVCSYDAIVEFLRNNPVDDKTAFDVFKDLDNRLEGENELLGTTYQNAISGCL